MSSPELSQFDEQFDAALKLAAWNTSTGGMNAWFSIERARGGAPHGDYLTELVRLEEARLIHDRAAPSFVPEPGVEEPEWMAEGDPHGVRLRLSHKRISGQGTTIEELQFERHTWDRKPGQWRRPLLTRFRPAQLGRICIRWCAFADTAQDLGKSVQTYLDALTPDQPEITYGDNPRFAVASLLQSFAIAMESGLPYESNAPYLDSLSRFDLVSNNNHAVIHEVTGSTLQAVLLDQPITKGKDRTWQPKVPTSLTFDAIKALDARGFLTPQWWMGACLSSGGAITVPDLLPIVYEKLAGEGGTELLSGVPGESAQALIKGYLTTLFNTYAKDRTRERNIAERIQKSVINKSGVADFKQLITIANGIIGGEDGGLDAEQRRPLLDVDSMFSPGDALLIVLDKTRPASATDAQWAAQFSQDVRHAEIVDTMYAQLRDQRREVVLLQIEEGSLSMRYPFATTSAELDAIRGRLTAGQSPAAVRAVFRSRQDAEVSKWRLRRPGSGYMS